MARRVETGSPADHAEEEAIYARVAERLGSQRAQEFREFIEGQNKWRRDPLAIEDQSDDE
jgi:hypothetical protein